MAPGFPGILGRTGFRGFPRAARIMLSYQEQSIHNPDNSLKEFVSTTEKPKSFQFITSQKLNIRYTKSFQGGQNRGVSLENTNLNGISIGNSSHSVPAYDKYAMKDLQKDPRQQRSLLWSPPQIISSVLKVFRKVLL